MKDHYQNRFTGFRLQEVEQGKVTLADLVAKKAEYEGGSRICTDAVTIFAHTPLGKALADYYASICEAITILQQL